MKDFFKLHLDSVGFWASIICAVHCAVLPLMILVFSWSTLEVVENNFIEALIITSTLCLAVVSLWTGYTRHNRLKAIYFLTAGILLVGLSRFTSIHFIEICLTSMGATLLASAHFVNWKLGVVHQHQKPKK